MFISIISKIKAAFSTDEFAEFEKAIASEKKKVERLKILDEKAYEESNRELKKLTDETKLAREKEQKAEAFEKAFNALATEAEIRHQQLKENQEKYHKLVTKARKISLAAQEQTELNVQSTLERIKARQNKKNRFK